ncbi:DUF2206 domain-containing protein [Desulfotomaculum copahuensis]|uniref:DUF2206 domain-containing protein n=1 Tax=Desulfotomaculum copahuensis TaxID=1838280 RepID=A0A1B7LDM1_9FIRM|nr:DUF2206 domain-containing protein [Desulfotomaculum copahuensis]OAT81206.1 hypothetical protein A6M21_11340 [Desulfotomaculum copahuensis]
MLEYLQCKKINEIMNKFLICTISAQLVFIGLSSFDFFNRLSWAVILISFAYLIIVPGLLLIRLIGIKDLNINEIVLHSVGLSLAFLMFIGFGINIIYPIFGLLRPISFYPLLITISTIIIGLWIACLIKEYRLGNIESYHIQNIKMFETRRSDPLYSRILFIIFPLLSILGALLERFYKLNGVLECFLIFVSLSFIFIILKSKDFNDNFGVLIFSISLSLLFFYTLPSSYLTGYDINVEYYFSNLVRISNSWNINTANNVNAMLSIVILPNIFSVLCKVPLTIVYKIFYPILASFIPMGLYEVYRRQLGNIFAFNSSLFVITIFPFYNILPTLARQEIAEIFVVLLLILISKKPEGIAGKMLFIIFGMSLVVSHYGTAYLYLFILLFSYALTEIIRRIKIKGYLLNSYDENKYYLNITYALLFLVFIFVWYINITSSSSFVTIIELFRQILSSIGELFNPMYVQGLQSVVATVSPLRQITRYLNIIAQLLIVIGFLAAHIKYNSKKFSADYLSFSAGNMIILMLSMILPFFAAALNITRIYQITTLVLAPFMILGGIYIAGLIGRQVACDNGKLSRLVAVSMSCFMAVFLLFNSGLLYQVFNDEPNVVALNNNIDGPRFYKSEVYGATWLTDYSDPSALVYADEYGRLLLYGLMLPRVKTIMNDQTLQEGSSYVFLREINVRERKLLAGQQMADPYISFDKSLLMKKLAKNDNRVFDGNIEIYYNQ